MKKPHHNRFCDAAFYLKANTILPMAIESTLFLIFSNGFMFSGLLI
jgi:hypothetical protein